MTIIPKKLSFTKMKIRKEVSPGEFLNMVKTKPEAIKASRVIPPKLGSEGWGKIIVELKN